VADGGRIVQYMNCVDIATVYRLFLGIVGGCVCVRVHMHAHLCVLLPLLLLLLLLLHQGLVLHPSCVSEKVGINQKGENQK
jgi:hypothetical protein